MNPGNECRNALPRTVQASLEARLAPFGLDAGPCHSSLLEDLDVQAEPAVTPQRGPEPALGLIKDLKLLFAALGAGNGVVPLGDNGRVARQLSEYARSLQSN